MTTTKPPVLNDDDEEFNNWHVSYASRPPNLNAPEGMWVDDKKAYAAWKYAKAQAVLERAGVDAVRDAALGEAMNAVPLDKMSSLQGATVIEAIRALKVTPAAAVADALPVIPGTPPRIWLVLGDDGDEPANFDELGEVTWCAHPQGPGDIEYVLAAPQAGQLSGNAGDVTYPKVTYRKAFQHLGSLANPLFETRFLNDTDALSAEVPHSRLVNFVHSLIDEDRAAIAASKGAKP